MVVMNKHLYFLSEMLFPTPTYMGGKGAEYLPQEEDTV